MLTLGFALLIIALLIYAQHEPLNYSNSEFFATLLLLILGFILIHP